MNYTINLSLEVFAEKIDLFFAGFRENEINEDDTFDFPELENFKELGWPELNVLINNHKTVLKDLIIYTDYEILHDIIIKPTVKADYYYSLNSNNDVIFEKDTISLRGICFKSDHIEHTYNYELLIKHALLKDY